MGAEAPRRISDRRLALLAALLLAAAVLAAFRPLYGADFVDYDDSIYVTRNERVLQGLTPDNVRWAFTTTYFGFYYPLTWLSHMTDCQLYGTWAGGHHLTSVLIHLLCALLLFGFLRAATGALWRSWLVALLFALHPLHVESVAWIAERKDVLSTLFLMAAFWAYVRYAKSPGAARYGLVAAAFILGLMAKSMVVTGPVLMLLLDWWPLGRTPWWSGDDGRTTADPPAGRPSPRGWLLIEKAPLLMVSALFALVTVAAQRAVGAVGRLEALPLLDRAQNACVACAGYLVKAAAPVNLSVFYPYPVGGWSLWRVALSAALLILVTLLAWRYRRRAPYLLTGWLWYLIALTPVIGLVQIGRQASADRYTYVPLVGLFVALSWGLGDLVLARPRWKNAVAGLCGAAVLALGLGAFHQAKYWRDGVTLFGHSIQVTKNNYDMLNALGASLNTAGRYADAAPYLKEAVALHPDLPEAWGNLGNAFRGKGEAKEAEACYQMVLKIDPADEEAYRILGRSLERRGELAQAQALYERAVTCLPDVKELRLGLGRVLARQGHFAASAETFRQVLTAHPDDPTARYLLALALEKEGRRSEAMDQLRQVLSEQPEWAEPWNRAALWSLARRRSDPQACAKAVRFARKACALTRDGQPEYLATLMEAQAACGDRESAGAAASKAITAARAGGDERLALALEARWRELSAPPSSGR
jgi:tetratricopeptide (TPR) repeat protein